MADQIVRDVVALRQPMERLARETLLRRLALELDAVRTMPGHGPPSFESHAWGSNLQLRPVRPEGPAQSARGLPCRAPARHDVTANVRMAVARRGAKQRRPRPFVVLAGQFGGRLVRVDARRAELASQCEKTTCGDAWRAIDVARALNASFSMTEMAGGPGFEPRLTESESAVLPLNYPPRGWRASGRAG